MIWAATAKTICMGAGTAAALLILKWHKSVSWSDFIILEEKI
jgi:hypothetical protein